jgi:hypothetical protein
MPMRFQSVNRPVGQLQFFADAPPSRASERECALEPGRQVAYKKSMKFTVLFCGLLAVGMATAILAGPPQAENSGALNNAVILIIRHAEKPAAGDQLSAAGQARAQAYANFFKNFTLDGQPLKLDYLFASADTKVSQRPRLTIEPTSKLLGLAIDCRFADAKFQELADEIRTKPHGQNILISWHHEEIPQLVKALGADPRRLFPQGKWPDEVFNWVVELRYDSNGHLTKASRGSEQF